MAAFQAIVQGRVQGVGFRWFVIAEAQQLGLRGQVRNLASSREVEVQAEGEQAALEALIRALRKGPIMSRVTDVQVQWLEDDQRFSDFSAAY